MHRHHRRSPLFSLRVFWSDNYAKTTSSSAFFNSDSSVRLDYDDDSPAGTVLQYAKQIAQALQYAKQTAQVQVDYCTGYRCQYNFEPV